MYRESYENPLSIFRMWNVHGIFDFVILIAYVTMPPGFVLGKELLIGTNNTSTHSILALPGALTNR
jgi:hypothetical protein